MHIRGTSISPARIILHVAIFGYLSAAVSCSPTRRIPDGEYLFAKNKIKIDEKAVDVNDIKKYEKQTPNKTILGLRFHLFLYNLASPKHDKFPGSWFRKIGEEPVIWDPVLSERTSTEFKHYLETKGYYDAGIRDTVRIKKRKAKVSYDITLNEPYRIRSVSYDFDDRGISHLILADTVNSELKGDIRFDKELLQEERSRLEELLRNNGYYKFSKEFIFFEAREVGDEKYVDLNILFKENIHGIPDPVTKLRKHHQYKIRYAFVYPNFTLYSNMMAENRALADTVFLGPNRIIYAGEPRIRTETVIIPNHCIPNTLYRAGNVKKTYTSYASLGLFRIINISFQDAGSQISDSTGYRYIDSYVELTPRKRQAYQIEVVGTNSEYDVGIRTNLSYNNYNLFKGAEQFQVKLTGGLEGNPEWLSWLKKPSEDDPNRRLIEIGVESTLTLPKFLVPFPAQKFTRKFNPRTTMNVSYSYQDRPKYLRTIASTSFGYRWRGNSYNSHTLLPVEFNFVRVSQISDDIWNEVRNTKLASSFENHTILATRYVFEYSNQIVEKLEDFIYFRSSLESAGNLISLITKDSLILDSVPYFHYLRYDFDLRYNKQITSANRIVYRFFGGLGVPLGKSGTLPFEKLYFSGGPYGLRAWNSGGLGPGSYNYWDSTSYYNRGELKIEANVEYRFKLFWQMEGAFFVDAGNIWTFEPTSLYPGGEFRWDRFYNEIAVGAGLGLRFDFSFLVIRTDFGFKMRDPAIQIGSRWIDFNSQLRNTETYQFRNRLVFQFGIGYPF